MQNKIILHCKSLEINSFLHTNIILCHIVTNKGRSVSSIHDIHLTAGDFLIRQVNYRCIPATPEALQKIRVCEGHQAYIDCPNERKIEIDYANYGRLKGAHVCGFLIAFNTNCGAESSMATVERDCTDQNSCLLEANNAKFGKDPCPLTLKYLEVSDVELIYFVLKNTPR